MAQPETKESTCAESESGALATRAVPRKRHLLNWGGVAAAMVDLLYPPHCVMCALDVSNQTERTAFCPSCRMELGRSQSPTCPRCAMPCPAADEANGPCPTCRSRSFRFAQARTLGPYDGPLRQAVRKMKHSAHEPLAAALGRRLLDCVQGRPFPEPPELVAPIPMHWLRRFWRGTNPPETIAGGLANELGLPFAADLLICRRLLKNQSSLSHDERRRNVRRAYRASGRFNIQGARVLLVDDVITTGATMHEAARALRKAGAAAVYAVAVARTTGDV